MASQLSLVKRDSPRQKFELIQGGRLPIMQPQDVAAQLSIKQLSDLTSYVDEKYHQQFGIVRIVRGRKMIVVFELANHTRYSASL